MPTPFCTRVFQRATAGAFWNEWDGAAEKGELAKKSSTKAERPEAVRPHRVTRIHILTSSKPVSPFT